MGKDFEKELISIKDVYVNAIDADVTTISKFLSKFRNKFILLVGSGGSFSVASAVEFMCIKAGFFAKSVTPLELASYNKQICNSAVILFTASGRNSDSINSYKYLSEAEPEGLLTVCMSTNSPISKIQKNNSHNFFFGYKMPVKKDGYLAVESLISSVVLMSKAFFEVTQNSFFTLDDNYVYEKQEIANISEIVNRESIIVLYGNHSKPLVIDLESKFGEAALGNIQTVDFRNFAHGRHFWLSKKGDSTSIIAFIDNSQEK